MKTRFLSAVHMVAVIALLLGLTVSVQGDASLSWRSVANENNLGPEVQNSYTAYSNLNCYAPNVAYDPTRKVYESIYLVQGAGWGIFYQTIDANGQVNKNAAMNIFGSMHRLAQPVIAFDPYHATYLVVFMQNTNDDKKTFDIYGVRLDENMNLIDGQPFKIISWTNRTFWTPRIALDSTRHRFLVVWNADDSSGQPTDIAASIVDPSTASVTPAFIVTTSVLPHEAAVVYNPVSDEYLVAWRFMDGGIGHIYGERLKPDPLSIVIPPGMFPLSNEAEDELLPDLGVTGAGNYIVAFERGASTTCCEWDIYAKEFDQNAIATGRQWIAAGTGYDETNPSLVVFPGTDTQFLVTYEKTGATGQEIWATYAYNDVNSFQIMPDRRLLVDAFPVANYGFYNSTIPVVAAGRIGALIAYQGVSAGDPNAKKATFSRLFTPFHEFLVFLSK